MTQGEYDLVSIGFGPAGLALAAAVDERQREAKTAQKAPPRAVFLEKQARTVWHGGLLLPGTHVNHHLLKDLVTPRNPQSPLSFASYLHEVDRFYEFCIWNGPVSRIEWSNYVTWVSTKLRHLAEYDNECTGIDISDSGLFRVSTRKRRYEAVNVVLSAGWEPLIPHAWRSVSPELFAHSSTFLTTELSIADMVAKGRSRILVVGSGMSAAEVVGRLYGKFGGSIELTSMHRGMAFKHFNGSEYAKPVFTPQWSQEFYAAEHGEQAKLLDAYHTANYGGIPPAMVTSLWKSVYEERLQGGRGLSLIEHASIEKVESKRDSLQVHIERRLAGTRDTFTCDFAILCSGYTDATPLRILSPIASDIAMTNGQLPVEQNYRINLKRKTVGDIYLNGHCEQTHGIADLQNFGMLAFKASVLDEAIWGSRKAAGMPRASDRAVA